MEDSRKSKKGGKKDFKRLIHTWMEKTVKKAILYNTKEEKRKGGEETKKKEKQEVLCTLKS